MAASLIRYSVTRASKLHLPSRCQNSRPETSKAVAPWLWATTRTSAAGAKRNSASGSMNFAISQGQATRSTLTLSLVIHFIGSSISSRANEKRRRVAALQKGASECKPHLELQATVVSRLRETEAPAAGRLVGLAKLWRGDVADDRPGVVVV